MKSLYCGLALGVCYVVVLYQWMVFLMFHISPVCLPAPATCRAVNRQAGKIREFHQAKLWCKDLHLHPALHPGLPDLSHRGWVRPTTSSLQLMLWLMWRGWDGRKPDCQWERNSRSCHRNLFWTNCVVSLCRYTAAGWQSPVIDWEEVQRSGFNKPICTSSAPTRIAITSYDLLGKDGLCASTCI